jgi:DNA helicase-2/ATP-dependent DNA helicase PcrA
MRTVDAVVDRFDHILVDEYQDTNLIQAEILKAMCRKRMNIMVVGDDAQAIYSFRAATVRNILDFPDQYPDTVTIKLEQNYRSNQPILDLLNAVMDEAPNRFTKNLFSDRASEKNPSLIICEDEIEQCAAVCDRVLEKRDEGIALMKQAVLFRASHHSDRLEIELTRRNIPFVKYGGLKFLEAAHVKDMICILRLLENPTDQLSWYRVLLLIEGIGPAIARRVMEELIRGHGHDPGGITPMNRAPTEGSSPLHRLIYHTPAVPPAARQAFSRLRCAVADCVQAVGSTDAELSTAAEIERIRQFYEPILDRHYDNATIRQRDLEQLEQIASSYTSRCRFLEDLAIDPPSSTQDLAGPPLLDEDYLILSTIHSSKGCEWDAVYIIHAADGMIPSDMATGDQDEIDEERRLLYVAMTRARDTLNIFFPLRYYQRGKGTMDWHTYAQLTRFIPKSALHRVNQITAHGARQIETAQECRVDSSALQSVHAMLHDLWRG